MERRAASVFVGRKSNDWSYLPEGVRVMTIAGSEYLAWINIQNGSNAKTGMLFAKHLGGSLDPVERPCPGRPGFILPLAGGDRLLVGLDKDLRICNLATGVWSEPIARIPDENPRTIINDGEVVPGGEAVVFGTKDTQFKDPIAELYLFTVADRKISLLAGGQKCSNGKVIREDDSGLILFDIDTPTKRVARYRLDVHGRKALLEGTAVDVLDQKGSPDGMCDCGDGTAIIAFYNHDYADSGRAVRFDLATGLAMEEWLMPGSPRVTRPMVHDGRLYATTAIEGMPAEMLERCPNAGCVFTAVADIGLRVEESVAWPSNG